MYSIHITMIFEKTLILQFYVNCTKKVFSHLQVCAIYLVNYNISKLAHESKLFLCSWRKIVKSKFFQKLSYRIHFVGCLHLVLVPFFILLIKRDIRRAAVATYVKTNTDDGEITFEQLQEHVGIGVQVS